MRIRNFFAVGENASRSWIVYDCEIITHDVGRARFHVDTTDATLPQGTFIRLLKRFSEFVALRRSLLDSFPSLHSLIPRLPARSSLGEYCTTTELSRVLTIVCE